MTTQQKIDISTSTLIRAVLVLLAFWLVYTVFDIVVMLFAAFIVAAVAEPIANYLERYKIPRALSVILFYLVILLALLGIIGLMIEPLAIQVRQVAVILPDIIVRLSSFTPLVPDFNQATVVDVVQTSLLRFGNNIANVGSNVFAGTRSFFSGLISFLFVFIIALYLVIERDALKKLAWFFTPDNQYPHVARAIEEAQRRVGRWVLGQAVLGIIMGLLVGIGLVLIGVPYALLLGLLVAVLELIPAIGPTIAAIPGVLVAFSQGWVIGLAALILYIVAGQIENHLLVPKIMERAVGLKPLVTIIAVILGARLFGLIGVVLAVPAAAVISVFVRHLFEVETDELAG